MLGRNSNNVRHVFSIGNAQDQLAEAARVQGRYRDPFADHDLERMWQEKYCPEKYDLDDLMRLSPDTLGGAYARHMKARGLRPDFYDDVKPRHKLHYLRLRLRQTHDIWHTLTGYDTDPVGELGLQGYYFGQVTNGQSALIFAGGLMRCLLTGSYFMLENYVNVFTEGYLHGRSARSLLPVKWEHIWSEALGDVRARYAIRVTSWKSLT